MASIRPEDLKSVTINFGERDFDASIDSAFRSVFWGRLSSLDEPAEQVDDATSARRALEAEERRLRPTVEKFFISTEHQVGWDDVIGNEEARRALVDAIESPVTQKALFEFYGTKPTKGVLLSGPPGCGKTMFGKAAANVLARLYGKKPGEIALLIISGPEIQSPYVGVTEQTIRQIFSYARAYKALHGHQLVVFIDEADAILPSRDGAGGRRATHWEESNVATFLTEMDGMEESGALVILATNRPFAIDAAILRDGRCDRKIKVKRPTEYAARVIVERSLTGAPLATGVDLAGLVSFSIERFFSPLNQLLRLKTTKGVDFLTLGDIVNGAMIVGLVERAKANAFRRDLSAGGTPTGLTNADIDAAVTALTAENLGNPDSYAIQEFAERLGVDAVSVELLSEAKPKIAMKGLH